MITTIINLGCDLCDNAYMGEPDQTPAELRRVAKRAGWRKRMYIREDGKKLAADLCPDCEAEDPATVNS